MTLRSLLATALTTALAGTLLVLLPSPAAHAGATYTGVLDAAWGRADLRINRVGWGLTVTGTMKDKRADGDCIYVEAVLAVDDYSDPDDRTPNFCGGKGKSTSITSISLRPGGGSRLASVRIRVCAADAGKDSCLEKTFSIPPETARRSDLKSKVDAYRTMSMKKFLQAKKNKPAPFNWSDNGCTNSPDKPGGFNFLPACKRHDFGYANYGHGSVKAAPTDAVRKLVDDRFLADMRRVCNKYSGESYTKCQGYATAYHQAVRKAGGKAFYANG
ncbi:MAG: hypothetical protein CMH83_12980 [Nocardioides sp.]|nr:hypothetical protein [Nocardioides sp.]